MGQNWEGVFLPDMWSNQGSLLVYSTYSVSWVQTQAIEIRDQVVKCQALSTSLSLGPTQACHIYIYIYTSHQTHLKLFFS